MGEEPGGPSDTAPTGAPIAVGVVGAGLAGLSCARRLHERGASVTVFERADQVGGRVRTDLIDGYRCDRGFQLLNPAYPEVPKILDVAELDLRSFDAGVLVAHGSQRFRLADPRRYPAAIADSVMAPIGGLGEKMSFAGWAMKSLLPVSKLVSGQDRPLAQALDAAGVRGLLRTGVVDQFLAGVLGEDRQDSSAQFASLLVRSFLLGEPSVPSLGMGRITEQLAAGLPSGSVRLGAEVQGVDPGRIRTKDGEHEFDAVVVAADPYTAERLVGVSAPTMRALTTFWHSTDTPPADPTAARLLHLDADHRGPLVNAAVLTGPAPTYAPPGRHLVASTMLGAGAEAVAAEPQVRHQLGQMFGTDTGGWDLVTVHEIAEALPAQRPPLQLRRPVRLDNGLFVAGDHRDTASIQGALVSGRRAAHAVLRSALRPV